MDTYDPTTGRWSRTPTADEFDEAAAYQADPDNACACPSIAGPHVHAPYAYPAWDAQLAAFVMLGG